MSPNQIRLPTAASPNDPRGLSKGLPEKISATFGVTRRKEGHPLRHHVPTLGEDVPEAMVVMSTMKQWVYLLAVDLFFLLFSFSFSLAWHLTDIKPLKT
ncbi:hypothetical protein J010_06759 [Cryptococcus neoformans]|nr:hypothetical protein C355_06777 [Cryptococcus neoformans var. grubii Th84]OXH00374.1 hypothetical protein J010_06759 [Cryptococcus neoformans var. grubii]OXH23748.1 hypothetical protein J009_06194 [Cryptococcus neoformans var. grubii]OXH41554.1 hypothetical protein J004_06799 [Cryptococcus neoformans var. grubii]OXH42530.1 hypothetical protein J003_06754 [Cryptococcus neoformans var. grubii]